MPTVIFAGERFWRLRTTRLISSNKRLIKWECECECGNRVTVTEKALFAGRKRSCGCMDTEIAETNRYQNRFTSLFLAYHYMRRLCYDKSGVKYKDFGGKGISVCKEWLDNVYAFKEWSLDHGYEPGADIYRYDQDAGFSPDNCYWWKKTKK
jgi:hypothetical protein